MIRKVLFLSLTRPPMRTFSLLLATLLFTPSALAQDYAIDRGSFVLAGSFDFSSTTNSRDDDRSTLLSVSPGLSYFVTSSLAIGAGLGVNRFSQDDLTSTSLSAGPRVAYYLGGPTSTVFPFAAAGVNYTDAEHLSIVAADLAAGAAVMLARNVGLNLEAFFRTSSYSREVGSDFSQDTFGLRGGVTVFVF